MLIFFSLKQSKRFHVFDCGSMCLIAVVLFVQNLAFYSSIHTPHRSSLCFTSSSIFQYPFDYYSERSLHRWSLRWICIDALVVSAQHTVADHGAKGPGALQRSPWDPAHPTRRRARHGACERFANHRRHDRSRCSCESGGASRISGYRCDITGIGNFEFDLSRRECRE